MSARARIVRTLRPAVPWLIALCLAGLALADHVRAASDPLRMNDDARQQVWPFLRFHDAALFQDDPVADYYLACLPLGYQAVYRVTAPLVDPRLTSRALPFVALAALLAGVWICGRAAAGRWAGWLAVFTVIAVGAPLDRMEGGLLRTFAPPLVALACAAAVRCRPVWLAATAVAGAALYPASGVLLSIALALYGVAWPGVRRIPAGGRSWPAAAGLLAVTAVGCLLVLLPPLVSSARYGPWPGPEQHLSYPEAGEEGRYRSESFDRPIPYPVVFTRSIGSELRARGVPRRAAGPAALAIVLTAAAAGALLVVRNPATRPLLVLLAASVVCFLASRLAFPRLLWPDRYVLHLAPILVSIVAALAAVELVAWWRRRARSDPAVQRLTVALALPLLIAVAMLPGKRPGLDVDIRPHRLLHEHIAALPPDALLAGWPRGELESVRLFDARRVLVDFENHAAYHARFIELMRPRAELSIRGALSPDDQALRSLFEDYGVTHFLVPTHFGAEGPRYFARFDTLIEGLVAECGGRLPAAVRLAEIAAVYRDRDHILLDLRLAAERGWLEGATAGTQAPDDSLAAAVERARSQ